VATFVTRDRDIQHDVRNHVIALDAAQRWANAGCAVIRVKADGTKAPLDKWKEYQQQAPNMATLMSWFGNGVACGIGVITGAVSGNMEMCEFEGRAVATGIDVRFIEMLIKEGAGNLATRLFSTGYTQNSPSGGLHVFYRVTGPVAGNTKLASIDTPEGVRPLIETRGEGGFVVVAPSSGTVHESGRGWTARTGTPDDIPTITEAERDLLHCLARSLTAVRPPVRVDTPGPALASAEGESAPGEDFNARGTWREILEPLGWTLVRNVGGREFWRRPGKDHGISAQADDYFYCYSSSVDLPHEEGLSKWRLYAMTHHNGDFSRAASALRHDGFGGVRQDTRVEYPSLPVLSIDGSVTYLPPVVTDTWKEKDLRPYLNGDKIKVEPSIGAWRNDEVRLLYPGKEHSVIGEFESGKSWFLLWHVKVEIRLGHHVVYFHYEEAEEDSTVERLIAMGVSQEDILTYFHFIAPETPMMIDSLQQHIDLQPTLVIHDGVNEVMDLHGWEVFPKTDGAAKFRNRLVRPFTNMGAAVLKADHIALDPDKKGKSFGSQGKDNGLNGAIFLLENREPFGRNIKGRSSIKICKDRPGYLKQHGKPTEHPRIMYFGEFIVDSSHKWSSNTECDFYAPNMDDDTNGELPTIDTHVSDRDKSDDDLIYDFIAKNPRCGKRVIRSLVKGTMGVTRVEDALTRLIHSQRVIQEDGPKNSKLLTVSDRVQTMSDTLESGLDQQEDETDE